MATLDEILSDAKSLAQLRLEEVVGAGERERVDAARRAAVGALERRAGVWLKTGVASRIGYFVPGSDKVATVKLQDFITGIASMTSQNSNGDVVNLDPDDYALFRRIEHGEEVIRVKPKTKWQDVDVGGDQNALLNITLNVGATAAKVTEILEGEGGGWEQYLLLMLSGYFDSRYRGKREGQPVDHAAAEREASQLTKPMART